ncbi:MAG: hypothetical protein BGP03_13610 [Pseudonocardia sp. 73-21]|nr:MAG: hypothetical protein BGP03_13610 [Pseudonocardia sp. 73-21]
MRGHEDRDATAGQLPDDREHLAHQLRVQRRGDLVEQQQPRRTAGARAIATRCCRPPESRSG